MNTAFSMGNPPCILDAGFAGAAGVLMPQPADLQSRGKQVKNWMTLFPMNFLMNSGQARVRLAQAGALFAAVALVAGCGGTYRPVVTPIGISGPPAQPLNNYAVVVSAPSPTTPGIVTIVDYSGDTVLVDEVPIGPGPSSFTLNQGGNTGYTLNSNGTLTNFPVNSNLQAKYVTFSTLLSTAEPLNLFTPSSGLWAADLYGNLADVFTASGGVQAFELAIPVATTPVMVLGPVSGGERNYAISQDFDAPSGDNPNGVACNLSPTNAPVNGEADAIELFPSLAVSAKIPVGKCPVYAVQSADNKRFFVLNRGDDTITVINSQNNTLDSCVCPPTGCLNQDGQAYFCHPTLPLSTTAVTNTGISPPNGITGMVSTAGPVYAEYNAATSQLIVADYDGGTISVIDVSMDEYGNDSPTFGTTFTIPVGNNPASVTVLYDGSRAYTANQTDGTVTIVNLSSGVHAVEKTLTVVGHPRTVVSTQNSQFGKVYVASPDSPYLTIIQTGGTDPDTVDTTILVQGSIVDVRVTTQNGTSGNSNDSTRIPGYGQPCYLPPALMVSKYGPNYTLAQCQTLP
jgi:DNA-binding beta-propeller fold protein YncE